MNIYVLRYPNAQGTPGDLIIERKVFCHTLEPISRPMGAVKIPGQTAISCGRYELVLNMSQRFGRILPEVLNVPNFSGVRLHGGNTTANTEGCCLCAYNIVSLDVIQGTAIDDLVRILTTETEPTWIEYLNSYPYSI